MSDTQRSTTLPIMLNAGLLLIVVASSWFNTFANPLADKFVSLSQSSSKDIAALKAEIVAQLSAQDRATTLSLASSDKITREIENSIDRRFSAQIKDIDEIRDALKTLGRDVEARRSEVTTRSDVQSLLGTTRLEFLSEIKRLDSSVTHAEQRLLFLEQHK